MNDSRAKLSPGPIALLLHQGWAVAEAFLTEDAAAHLVAVAQRMIFTKAAGQIGHVRQDVAEARVCGDTLAEYPEILDIVREIQALVRSAPDLARWAPNEVTFSRYESARGGITAHRDSARYTDAIAVITLVGHARLAILADRAGPVVDTWIASPGDLMLLRGSSNDSSEADIRPFHQVGPPLHGAERLVLAVRHDRRSFAPPLV